MIILSILVFILFVIVIVQGRHISALHNSVRVLATANNILVRETGKGKTVRIVNDE